MNYTKADAALSSVEDDDTETFQDFRRYVEKQGLQLTIPHVGDSFSLGIAEIYVMGPVSHAAEDNNNSIVLKVTHGNNSILLTGDAEKEEEQEILRQGFDLQSTVLKVAHHGSASSSSPEWLSAINPEIAVISCGIDNEYGHPTETVLSRLQEMNVQLFRTDLQGTIVIREEDGALICNTERDAQADIFEPAVIKRDEPQTDIQQVVRSDKSDEPENTNGVDYVLNTNTKKFHYPSCKSVGQMKEENKLEFSGTRDEVIAMGYDPCGNCHP